MAVCPCGDVFGEPVAVGLVVAGHPGDGDVGGWGEVELVVGGGDFHDDVGFCFKGQGFDDRCDGGNCGFVSGEEESACSAGAPVQSGAPVGGTVVWADEDEGVAWSCGQCPGTSRACCSVGDEVDVDGLCCMVDATDGVGAHRAAFGVW